MLKVEGDPLHTAGGLALAEVAVTDGDETVTVTLTHAVVLHDPSALT